MRLRLRPTAHWRLIRNSSHRQDRRLFPMVEVARTVILDLPRLLLVPERRGIGVRGQPFTGCPVQGMESLFSCLPHRVYRSWIAMSHHPMDCLCPICNQDRVEQHDQLVAEHLRLQEMERRRSQLLGGVRRTLRLLHTAVHFLDTALERLQYLNRQEVDRAQSTAGQHRGRADDHDLPGRCRSNERSPA